MANKNSFLVQIKDCQHTTWQGTVTWMEKEETTGFRSMLELIKLMDAAVGAEAGQGNAGGEWQ